MSHSLLIAQWLLREQEKLRGTAIEEPAWLVGTETMEYLYSTGTPAILKSLAARWPALQWSPHRLRELLGGEELFFAQCKENDDPDYEIYKDRHTRIFTLNEVLEGKAYITAYNAAANASVMELLWNDVRRLGFLLASKGFPWIGQATFTPLHYDQTNNLIVQLVGEKEIWLGPPSLGSRLQNSIAVFSDIHDIDSPRTPCDITEADGYRVTLRPGDALFIPFGWWHQVRSRAFSVTLTYTNFVWPNNMADSYPKESI